MVRLPALPLIARLALPLVVALALHFSPLPGRALHALEAAGSAASDDPLQASQRVAAAAAQLPWRADLWPLAGRLAYQAGDLQSAAAYFSAAGLQKPLGPEALLQVGDIRAQAGDLPGAVAAWVAIPAGSRSVDVYTRLADAHAKLGDPQGVIADLRASLDLQPENAPEAFLLGKYLAIYQPEAAAPVLDQAARDPQDEGPVTALRAALLLADRSDQPAYRAVVVGRALGEQGDWSLASQAFELALQEAPQYADAWALLGEARQQLGGSGEGEITHALQLGAGSPLVQGLAARFYQREGNLEQAAARYRQAAALEPRNPVWPAQLGEVLAQAGDLDAALASYRQAAGLSAADATYWSLLADFTLRYSFQVHEAGLPAARQALELNPDDPAALDLLGQVFMSLEDFSSANQFLERALQADDRFAPAALHLGQLDLVQGWKTQARTHFELALNLQPSGWVADQARAFLRQYFP